MNSAGNRVVAAGGGEAVVLGIETSCDETAAAVVARSADGRGRILSNIVRSQWDRHSPFGGVVPEIAARAHVECLDELIGAAMAEAEVGFAGLAGVAATAGPGLVGGLIVGLMAGKAIAMAHGLPLIAVNHLEAHALTVGLTEGLKPPYLMLLVSGGHTQTLVVDDVGAYRRIGTTVDDALGEAFDKTAKILGLGLPGGPQVEHRALEGNPGRFALPRPMLGREEPHFSFAGLKTAVRQRAVAMAPLSEQDVADLCAGFEAAVTEAVADRVARAVALARETADGARIGHLVVAGGVAANLRLRSALADVARAHGFELSVPPTDLCGDNAAMIAWAGAERLARRLVDDLDAPVRPRWPLDVRAAPAIGAGVKA